uniref:START domain-containing protein n=1 Tax=Parascaris univalens TaxID=6257 RepID=A0A915B6K0_PARUN
MGISLIYLQYKDALYNAGKAMEDLMEICQSAQFETHEGWEKRASRSHCIVYSKAFNIGTIFTLRAEFNFPVEQLFNEHWKNFDYTPQFSRNASFVRRVEVLTPFVDVIHYGLSEAIGIKARDFLAGRIHRRLGNEIFVATRSFEHEDFQELKNSIRGNLILGGGRIRAHPSDPRKTIVDYVLCADLKGLDVSGEKADQTLIKFMIEDIESAKDQIEKIKVRAKKQSQGDEEEHLF